MKQEEAILDIFRKNEGYAHTTDILVADIHNYYLQRMVEQGKVVKLRHGLYRLASVDVNDELEDVSRMVPGGVVCLFSAWNYHELSDFVPPEYHLAIEKSRKLKLPTYPPIQLYYWSMNTWELGITEVTIGNTKVAIYDQEKSVCDAIKFRNKIGKEVEKEVLKSYLQRKDRNIDQLIHYAELLRVEKRLREYLTILL